MLLLLNVIEMIVYIKHLYYGRFDDFHPSYFFLSNKKKKLKSTLIEKNSEDYLSNKNTNSIFSSLGCKCIAEINYEIFSIRPKAYSYLISVQHYIIIYVISTKSEFLFGIYDEYLSCFI
jgi:hypothetical protein